MKLKKIEPFLDEVTTHGELFRGPKEVFVCPECGSEHVEVGEIEEFGLPSDGIFSVEETHRECVCSDCGCEFKRIYGHERALSDGIKGACMVVFGVLIVISCIISFIFWGKICGADEDEWGILRLIGMILWPLVATVFGFGGFWVIGIGARKDF